jgi:hypothetical protein
MASTSRTHIAKQEELVAESAVQLRDDDPITPVEGQLWINTFENKLKLKKDNDIKILVEGHIGAAAQLQASGILDAAISRSYYKSSSEPFAVTSVANLVEGVSLVFRVTNPAANVKTVQTITALNSASITDGSLFYVNSAMDVRKYFTWFDKDGLGLATPAVAGRTGIRVVYTPGRKNKTTVTCPAASSLSTGQHFLLSSANNATNYYVWINKDGGGINPNVAGRTGISVAVVGADTSTQVASKISAAIAAVNLDFTSSSAGSVVTFENTVIGATTATANGTMGGITIATPVVGAGADTATQVAQAIFAAMTAVSVGTGGIADFFGTSPVTSTLTLTNQITGYTSPPIDVNSSMVPVVTVAGSGGYILTVPNTFYFDDTNSTATIQGGKTVLFRMFRSGAFILCASSQYTT